MSDRWTAFKQDIKGYTHTVPAAELNYSLHLSLLYRYVFVENPKVGCSTIKLILQRIELNDPGYGFDDPLDVHVRKYSPLLRPVQLGKISELLQEKELFKFCFVRNPYSRLLSVYLDKINDNHVFKGVIAEQLGRGPDKAENEISFGEFVSVVSRQSVAEMNHHWRTQYYQTYQDEMKYDVIGRFESFEEDLRTVLSRITPEYEQFLTTNRPHKTDADKLITQYYTDEIEESVYTTFKTDFEHFEYPRL